MVAAQECGGPHRSDRVCSLGVAPKGRAQGGGEPLGVWYEEGWERPALKAALEETALPPTDWEFLGSSRDRAAFRSVQVGVFAKVTSPQGIDRMGVEASVARWAAAAGVPVADLLPEVSDQPIIGHFGAATFWPLYEPVPAESVDMAWMGQTLAALHRIPPPPALPPWNPATWFDQSIADLRSVRDVRPRLVDHLVSQGRHIIATVQSLTRSVTHVVLHGDAYPDNVVAQDHCLRLVDFELSELGPAVFDLAPTVVLARRFAFPSEFSRRLLSAYGDHDHELLNAMVDLAELRITCGAIGFYTRRYPTFQTELAVRVQSLGDAGTTQWTPHRELLKHLPTD